MSCWHDFKPKAKYQLPYLGEAELCPLCAIELAERLNFKLGEKHLRSAVRGMRKGLSKSAMEHFFASEPWQKHADWCTECGWDESRDFRASCYRGKVIFIQHFAPIFEKAGVA